MLLYFKKVPCCDYKYIVLKIFFGVIGGWVEYILSEVYFFYTNLKFNIYLCKKNRLYGFKSKKIE